ncbi:MAG: DUF2148 domain-containing protein [Thermoplasmata archaeon]
MEDSIELISNLMAISARTAPKSLGESYLKITLLDKAEKEILTEEMFQMSDELNDDSYSYEGEIIREAAKVIIIGLEEHPPLDLDCRACGFKNCEDFSDNKIKGIFEGPNCAFHLIDMGMAVGGAIDTAQIHNIRSKISLKGGLAAKNVGISTSKVCIALMIDLSEEKDYL